ncbi:MAG: hypothetical protein PHI06_15110 [Desulfobulbaceae bacterium]|nr:hypothetical protein [Desulfobulbaceae bacterium]
MKPSVKSTDPLETADRYTACAIARMRANDIDYSLADSWYAMTEARGRTAPEIVARLKKMARVRDDLTRMARESDEGIDARLIRIALGTSNDHLRCIVCAYLDERGVRLPHRG